MFKSERIPELIRDMIESDKFKEIRFVRKDARLISEELRESDFVFAFDDLPTQLINDILRAIQRHYVEKLSR